MNARPPNEPTCERTFRDMLVFGGPYWVVCKREQADWIVSEGMSFCSKPAKYLGIDLDRGAPQVLRRLLGAVSPNLPFDRLVEADFEHLLLELSLIVDDRDGLFLPGDERDHWFGGGMHEGSICIDLHSQGEVSSSAARSALSALRLASFCIVQRGSRHEGTQQIVIDSVGALTAFDNSVEDGSGNMHFIFKIVPL